MSIEPFESQSHLNEYVGMFEAAAHPRATSISLPTVSTILLAKDGSNQDETALRASRALAGAARIVECTPSMGATEILTAAKTHQADAIVLPVPFGRDYGVLKGESLGSVVDMLLLESTCPVLCVRDLLDEEQIASAFARPILPVTIGNSAIFHAAGWAFRMVSNGGTVDAVAIADEDVINEAKQCVTDELETREFIRERVIRSITRELGGVFSAIQKEASTRGVNAQIETFMGRFVPIINQFSQNAPRLIVWGMERRHDCPTFHRATDLILSSRWPVLIV